MYNKKLFDFQSPLAIELTDETVIQGSGNPKPKSVHLTTKPGVYTQAVIDGLLVLVHEDQELTPETKLRTHRKTVKTDYKVSVTDKNEKHSTSVRSFNNDVVIWVHKRDKMVDVIILDSNGAIFETPTKEIDGDIYEVNYHIAPARNGRMDVYVEISKFLLTNPGEYIHTVYQSWSDNVHWNMTTKRLNQLIDEASETMKQVGE